MQTRKFLIALTMVVNLILAGCVGISSTFTDGPPDALADTSWSLQTLNGQPVLAEPAVTLTFADGQVGGTDGCNSFSASYTVNGEKITVDSNMVSTMMACADPIMQQAGAYTAALMQAATFKIDGQTLTLMDGNGAVSATFAGQSSDLSGTSWVVTGYNNGKQAVVSVVIGSELTAAFSPDGQLSGSAGCNNFTASFELSDKTVKIGSVGSTRKMCNEPAGVMEQEQAYLSALETAATYRIDGNQLELRTADGALAVTFIRGDTAVTSQP